MRDEVWGPGLSSLRDQCRADGLLGSVLQELEHALLHELFPGCRLFRIDSELRGPERQATQRFFVLRPGDARSYQLLHHGQMVALARAEDVRLDTPGNVAAFCALALGVEDAPAVEKNGSAWLVGRPDDPSGEQLILRVDAAGRLVDILRVRGSGTCEGSPGVG